MHVTLAFLGHMPEERIEEVRRAAGGALEGAAVAVLRAGEGVVAVPRRRPRLFALDLGDPDGAAGAVQAALAADLASAGLYQPETKPFWPHVTLARVRRGRSAPVPEGRLPALGELRCTGVALYRSRLRREGARYEALARFRLSAP